MDCVYSKHAFEMNEVKGLRTRCVVSILVTHTIPKDTFSNFNFVFSLNIRVRLSIIKLKSNYIICIFWLVVYSVLIFK